MGACTASPIRCGTAGAEASGFAKAGALLPKACWPCGRCLRCWPSSLQRCSPAQAACRTAIALMLACLLAPPSGPGPSPQPVCGSPNPLPLSYPVFPQIQGRAPSRSYLVGGCRLHLPRVSAASGSWPASIRHLAAPVSQHSAQRAQRPVSQPPPCSPSVRSIQLQPCASRSRALPAQRSSATITTQTLGHSSD